MENKTTEQINELRKVMGTLPHQEPQLRTEFTRGVEGITVELVDTNKNPYKGMYVLATSCWGKGINKWAETSPENRFLVVKAALEGDALPLAAEVPFFTFAVEGLSRAAFDQLARTRDAVFSAKGMRDNNWKDCNIRIPTSLWPTLEERMLGESLGDKHPDDITEEDKKVLSKLINFENIKKAMIDVKKVYGDIVDTGKASWQAARTVLPLYVEYGFSVRYHYLALKKVCANRMKFCEMEDTCAVGWLYQKAVEKVFPLLASYLRPGCDFGHKCQYHKSYGMSELFGCLFSECGRNKCEATSEYAEFNETCTNYKDLEEQLEIHITRPDEWPTYTWETLPPQDKLLFMED